MYNINNDFIDSFAVLFCNGESLINRQRNPLGSYVVELLNSDGLGLGQISMQAKVLKETMLVFLSARDPSSAAEAQQAINAMWSNLLKLPAYKLFAKEKMSHQNLIRYLRDHPNETNDMITPGTERHKSYIAWLAKLERLTDSLSTFLRDTKLMLEEYFTDLPERTASAYAKAYARYRDAADSAFELSVEAQEETGSIEPVEHIEVEFPVNVSFVSVKHHKKRGGATIAERMVFDELSSFFYMELYRGMAAGNLPRRCDNCGKWFLLTSGYDIRYCTSVAPDETSRTCRQVGAHRKEKERNGTEFIRREYSRTYNRLKQRKNRGAITVDEWNTAVASAQELCDRARRGEVTDAELKRLLDKY